MDPAATTSQTEYLTPGSDPELCRIRSRPSDERISNGVDPLKLLFISAAYPPMRAGEADHAYHQCCYLAKRGVDVHVLTGRANQWTQEMPFTVHPIMRDWSWRDLPRLVRFVKRCNPDAVFLFYIGWVYNDHPMITFLPAICRRTLPHARLLTMFAYPMGSKNERLSWVSRGIRKAMEVMVGSEAVDYSYGTILRDSDALIVMSERHRRMLAASNPGVDGKHVLIPPPPLLTMTKRQDAASRQETREKFGFTTEDIVLVYFGLIYPPKGVETLLRAFHLVSRGRRFLRLLLVGGVVAQEYPDRPRFAEEMRELPKQLGFADKVIWTGEFATGSDEASRYLYASDICVFPHDFGLYLNNSSFAAVAAHGLPVVATRGEFIEEAFVDGENLIFCQPKSPESMASAITRIVDDCELRQRLAKGALRLAEDWFSWEHATARILGLLEERR